MQAFISSVNFASRTLGLAAAALIAAAALVICQMVFVRYVMNASTVWQTEFVTYALIGATFIGSPYVLLTRGHVNVDLIPLYLSPRLRLLLAWLTMLLAFAFCATVAWLGAELTWEAWDRGWRSESLWGPPMWIPYAAVPLGMGMVALQYLAEMAGLATGRADPFHIAPGDTPNE